MLRIDDLSKAYAGVPALRDASLTVPSGAISAIIGANGAGKSTLLRIAAGLLAPDKGLLHWNGAPLADALPRERRAYLPEERGLYQDVAVADLLGYWARLRGLSRNTAGDAVRHWAATLGVEACLDQHVAKLSKGKQQKVQLASCLLHAPDLLVLDEPFSGLDALNQELVARTLRESADRGCAVLLSAHQLDVVERMADSVHVMSAGTIQHLTQFGSKTDRSALQRPRVITVHLSSARLRVFDGLPAHEMHWVSPGRTVRLTFNALDVSDFARAVTLLATCDAVHDLAFEEPSLRGTYLGMALSDSQ